MVRRAMALTMLLVGMTAAVVAQPRSDDDLVGLWGADRVFGPELRGELLLRRVADRWIATLGGAEASASVTADTLRLVFPAGLGEFRGRIAAGTVRGFWVQPVLTTAGYRFATPVVLAAAGPETWRGPVAPLEDRITLYLLIRRAADGTLSGSFHNPDMRWNGGLAEFRVRRDGDAIELADPSTGRVRFKQAYDSAQRRITMDFGTPFALEPRDSAGAIGFIPRPGGGRYRYQVPATRTDGWVSASPEEVGVDRAVLGELVERLIGTDPTAAGAPLVHSVLVARRGRLVLEEYFFGYSADRPHDLRSASKTVTSILAGIAMDRQPSPFTMATAVYPLLGVTPDDPRKAGITVGHLLTHATGLACDDNDAASPGNEDRLQRQRQQPDWYRFILDLPMAVDPGSRYAYCSGTLNLTGAVIRRATGQWLPEVFDRSLAQPLGIARYHINLMPDGEGYSGGGLRLLPRDLLKLGQLYLDGGRWRGRAVVGERWVRQSTAHQMATADGGSDGFGWHRFELEWNGRKYREYEASGNGGQLVIVVPELDLVVAFTAGNYNQYRIWRKFREELVPRYLIRAVADPGRLR